MGGDCLPLLAPSTRSPTFKNPRSPTCTTTVSYTHLRASLLRRPKLVQPEALFGFQHNTWADGAASWCPLGCPGALRPRNLPKHKPFPPCNTTQWLLREGVLQLFFYCCGGCVVLQGRPPRLSQDISTVWAVTACLCLLRRRDLRPLSTPVPQPVPQLTCRTCRFHWSRLFNVEGCTGSENVFANIEEPRPNNPVTRGSSAIGKLVMIGVVHILSLKRIARAILASCPLPLGFFGLVARCRSRGVRRCTESDQDRKKRTIEPGMLPSSCISPNL